MGGLSIGRVAVVSEPGAIRRVLLENTANYKKDWLQQRILSAGLTNGLLTAEGNQWKVQRRALAPLFSAKTVMNFSEAMTEAANALAERLISSDGKVVDLAVEATRVTLDVLERTIFSDGIGRNREDIRIAMKSYFEELGRIDPLDLLGIPAFVPRPGRWKVQPMLRLFDSAIDSIIATRREKLATSPDSVPRDILTLLLEAKETIVRGTLVVVAPYVLHRHRALWGDPDRFDPSRFLNGGREKNDRYSYLPFGVGPRICIGAAFALQEASVVVATILRHFTFTLVPGHTVWPVQKVTLRPRGGLPMIVRRRN